MLLHRLARALPKRLCAEAESQGSGAAPGVLLLFWAPAAPPPGVQRVVATCQSPRWKLLHMLVSWGLLFLKTLILGSAALLSRVKCSAVSFPHSKA